MKVRGRKLSQISAINKMSFEDIFNKLGLRKQKSITGEIIADNREKNSLVISEIISLGAKIKFEQLEIGDYIIGETAIERKTVSDFISSMINKRLVTQLQNLQKYKKRLLIIEGIDEGEIYSEKGGINPNAIRGFILSISLDYEVPIVMTKNSEDTAKYLLALLKRLSKKKSSSSLRHSRSEMSPKERMEFILEGFPDIGSTKSKKLLEKFKNLENIFNARMEELEEILGKRAEEFKEWIRRNY